MVFPFTCNVVRLTTVTPGRVTLLYRADTATMLSPPAAVRCVTTGSRSGRSRVPVPSALTVIVNVATTLSFGPVMVLPVQVPTAAAGACTAAALPACFGAAPVFFCAASGRVATVNNARASVLRRMARSGGGGEASMRIAGSVRKRVPILGAVMQLNQAVVEPLDGL